MIFLDTETCGLHGPIVLLQYAIDDGPIYLHSVFTSTVKETLELIEMITNHEGGIVGFNLAYDWFHICQTYTTLVQFSDSNARPIDNIDRYTLYEERGRNGDCLKPVTACDIMLWARKGPYQSTMKRKDIKIKKVPTPLAWELAKELDKRIPLKDVYFEKKQDPTKRWQVVDLFDDFGEVNPEFKDLALRFAPSSALKALAKDALGIKTDDILLFSDTEISEKYAPVEYGYAPFALAVGNPGNWHGAWPTFINTHVSHWIYNQTAHKYASDDVDYTRRLYKHFGSPPLGDDDSILACMIGAVRWKGFKIDAQKIVALKNAAENLIANIGFNFKAPEVCKRYLFQAMGETEKLVMRKDGKITTKAMILEEIAKWKDEVICPECKGMCVIKKKEGEYYEENNCDYCNGEGTIKSDKQHPAALRAQEILNARHAQKEIEIYDKLLLAGRFHASLVVIGARSSRMSGADQLNPQGIRRAKETRQCFPLADDNMELCGGDFDAFEVSLADAAYGDEALREDLMSGKSLHGLLGTFLFPNMTYEQIIATKGLPGERDKYTRSKNGVFSLLYGGDANTLRNRVGVSEEAANDSYNRWVSKYKTWGLERKKIFDKFCSMKQVGGIGTQVTWSDPADYIESMFGFKRFFTLENQICKALFNLAEKPPAAWNRIKIKVIRRDREQTASGAIRSALFAAAFALQAASMRAASNHVIQSSGATLTKVLQKRLWDLQEPGINKWKIQPLNIHDEIMSPMREDKKQEARAIVEKFIEEFKVKIPLLSITWKENLKSWGDK